MADGWSPGRKLALGVGVLVVLIALISANLLLKPDDGGTSFQFGGKGKEMDFVLARRGALESYVEASGVLEAAKEVKISAEVVGRIQELRVAEGDPVIPGQVLLRLEPTEIQARVDRQRANLEITRANLERIRAELVRVTSDAERQEELYEQGLLSTREIESFRTQLRVQDAQLWSAEQSVAQARADLDSVLKDLDKTVLTSPIAGVVTRLHAKEGEVVVTGTMNNPGSIILEVGDLSALHMEASVDQNEVLDVRLDQAAKVVADALIDEEWAARVLEIASSGRRIGEVTVFPVKVLLEEPSRDLRPGMTAHVTIVTDSREDALLLPVGAVLEKTREEIIPRDERAELDAREAEEVVEVVFLMEEGRAVPVEVETGISDDYDMEILSGLNDDDPVLSGPFRLLRFLKRGDRVRPSEDGQRVLQPESAEEE